MPAGLRIRKDGVVQLDTSSNMGRIVGSIDTGTTAGSINIPEFAGGKGFFQLFIFDDFINKRIPLVVHSGTTLSWSFADNPSPYDTWPVVGGLIVYGIK